MPRDEHFDGDLTDAEREELEDQQAGKPAAQPAAVDGDAGAEAAARAAETLAEANRVLEQARQLSQQAELRANPPPPPRDFDKELGGLKDAYDNGELDIDEYVAQRDSVRDAQRDAQRAAESEAEAAAQAQQQAQQQWQVEYTEFMQSEAHAKLHGQAVKKMFDELAVAGVRDGKSYQNALIDARDQVYRELGFTLPNVDTAVAARATKDRPGPTLGDLPAAGGTLDSSFVERLASLDIEDLEERIAGMSTTQREQFLSAQPGGLRDNPRGRSFGG